MSRGTSKGEKCPDPDDTEQWSQERPPAPLMTVWNSSCGWQNSSVRSHQLALQCIAPAVPGRRRVIADHAVIEMQSYTLQLPPQSV